LRRFDKIGDVFQTHPYRVAALACLTLLGASTACAYKSYAPTSGQPGKDMVWVPTPQATVDMMLDMADVTAADYVIDLGSGDGRLVISAAQRGARALGIEYNPDLVALSKRNARTAGVGNRAMFREADIFKTDFSEATVLPMFMLPDLILRIQPKILAMRPGTRVVSNTFMIESDEGDWVPDETRKVSPDCMTWCTAHLWIVPARVAGQWMLDGTPLVLDQQFQRVTGTLGGAALTGTLRGATITFSVAGTTYTGTVSADGRTITGTNFTARRS
jgi:SAM-dependent methyltransferase